MHDELKEIALVLAALSWAGLAVSLVGVGRFRLRGSLDGAVVFLITAVLTRLAFTHVRTRWQIAAFVLVASVAAAGRLPRIGIGGAMVRWAASVAGIVVGAVATREVVHHLIERWL